MPHHNPKQPLSMRLDKKLLERVDKKLMNYDFASDRTELVSMLLEKWCNGAVGLSNNDNNRHWC